MTLTVKRVGLGYVGRDDRKALSMTLDGMHNGRDGVKGMLGVSCGLPGLTSGNGHLHHAQFNLSSTTARNTLIRYLKGRTNGLPGLDWDELVEEFCRQILDAERNGSPPERAGNIPVTSIEIDYQLKPILPKDQVTLLYGDGKVGKSTLAAAMAVSVEVGAVVIDGWVPDRGPVLYLDWEAGRDSINRRVRGIAMGAHFPPGSSIAYMDCRRRGPLYRFAEQVARYVSTEGYQLVVVDSVGMASGSSSEGGDANETAVRLFEAFGYLGTTVLGIDHISKAASEDPSRKASPYGSIYKRYLARQTFEVKRSRDESVIGVYHQDANDSGYLPPMGLAVEYGVDGSITYVPVERLPDELTRSLGLMEQICHTLADGPMIANDLAALLERSPQTVREYLRRGSERGVVERLSDGSWAVAQEQTG